MEHWLLCSRKPAQLVTDQNQDEFFRFATVKTSEFLNRWQYTDAEKGWVSFASVRYLDDQKQTGSVDFDPTTDRGISSLWGSEFKPSDLMHR